MKEVFEIVDYSDDEKYYALGIFATLEQAKHEIDCIESDDRPISHFCYDEHERIVILKRKFGWTEHGTEVYSISREEYYDEQADEYKWKRSQPQE